MEPQSAPTALRQFPCTNCGANLVFQPGTNCLVCPYCHTENRIETDSGATVTELDYNAALHEQGGQASTQDTLAVKCTACAAESQFPSNVVARDCPFCGAPLVATAESKKQIKPGALLPFVVTHNQAGAAFKNWVSGLWFAPSAIVRDAQRSAINGAYIPAWTYDTQTYSHYTGQRGDNYWDTETYTETDAQGNSQVKTRQVQRTRWSYANGQVQDAFDDLLVLASRTLPAKQAQQLEPWDLKHLVPYRDEYLSGFVCESYQVDLASGFEEAKGIMKGKIEESVRADIGGDHQRIDTVDTDYQDITFKHTLLPIWISAYRFNERVFRFLVNARSGEVQGERPYSVAKITSLILAIIAVVMIGVLIAQMR